MLDEARKRAKTEDTSAGAGAQLASYGVVGGLAGLAVSCVYVDGWVSVCVRVMRIRQLLFASL